MCAARAAAARSSFRNEKIMIPLGSNLPSPELRAFGGHPKLFVPDGKQSDSEEESDTHRGLHDMPKYDSTDCYSSTHQGDQWSSYTAIPRTPYFRVSARECVHDALRQFLEHSGWKTYVIARPQRAIIPQQLVNQSTLYFECIPPLL